jgi:hypothetical protein
MMTEEQIAKARATEKALGAWLKQEGFSYLAVCQKPETFAPLFRNDLKRPDYLVLLESVGMMAVDVKSNALSQDEFSLPYETEVRRTITFERIFRLPVWYAYQGEKKNTWYWISALKAVEVGKQRTNKTTQELFLAINLKHFECVCTNADLGKLYTHRLPGLSKIKAVQPGP